MTPRDLYNNDENINDWLFGISCPQEGYSIISTARLKRKDSVPSQKLIISKRHYMKRLELIAIHEIGHDIIYPKKNHISYPDHFKIAKWVNSNGHEQWLDPHCIDNKCIMYETVDIISPPKEEGYMKLGSIRRYDTGFDEMLRRMKPGWFCKKCKDSINIDESYFR